MADNLGPIAIPDPPVLSAFPLTGDYGSGLDYAPPVAIHVFDQPGLKVEQRFLLGSGARRFRIVRARGLACTEYELLREHFRQAQGCYAQFPYSHPLPNGTLNVTARYENPSISFDHLYGMLCSDPGVTLLEVPSTAPSYTSSQTLTRFPDTALAAALQDQVQQFIPLITITPRADTDPTHVMRLSNQRVTIDGNLYLARLVEWSGIQQTLSEASDAATFTFGNSDDVFLQYANQINLYRATVQFSLFHVGTKVMVNFWAGYVRTWQVTSDGKFVVPTTDAVFELSLAYPWRNISRTCWKIYKGPFCPSTSSLPDCPKSYDACQARGVPKSFGGVVANPTTVHIKDNSTGVFGWGRSSLTSVSVADDSIYQRAIREVYTDEDMIVDADVAAGRDEDTFYSALGIVSEGPLTAYCPDLLQQRLDSSPPHDPQNGGGWRGILGTDPAGDYDYFALDEAPWTNIPAGSTYAAGLAFAEIRRTDAAGLQLSPVSDRAMKITVRGGIAGWTWTAPGSRVWTAPLTNCVWVAVNVYLRALGLRAIPSNAASIPAATMEGFFDVQAAINAAAICDTMVDKLIGTGQEKQFPFRGVLKEQKSLKSWLQEILNCCLGYFTFVNGKLWIGIRVNSSVLTGNAFTRDTILYQSLQATPLAPQFNWLIGEFGDEEFQWALNTVTIYDIDHATFAGNGSSPQYTQNTMTFVGVSNKSQCARIITTRLREELGGVGLTEQANARNLSFKTTLLAMATKVGDIISVDSTRLPGSPGRCEGRVQQWTLNPDFSIDILASATTDSMYDLDIGPKPDDVPADPIIPERLQAPQGLVWMPNHVAPLPADPMYPLTKERTFDLWQDYSIRRDGVWEPAVFVAGEMVVNQFAQLVQPRIADISISPLTGNIDGPCTIYVAVTQHDANGNYTVPSNEVAIWIPDGAVNQGIRLQMLPAAGTWTGWDLWAGTDRRSIGLQDTYSGALPAQWDMPGDRPPGVTKGNVAHMTQAVPEAAIRKVRVAAKRVWAAGIAPVLVTDVTYPDQIQCDDFKGSADNWVGRYMSTLGDASDGSAPLWNFQITGFNATTGTFTVFPQAVLNEPSNDSVQPGDVLAIRSIATSAGTDWVEDTMWNNSVMQAIYNQAGWDTDANVGRIYRILRGTGQGQIRQIVSNTNVRHYVDPPWDTVPDNTSVGIIEAAGWDTVGESSELDVPGTGTTVELRLRLDNLADTVVLVGGFAVDDQGNWTDEELACFREIYIFGEPPSVRAVGPGAGPWQALTTDQTIRCDTSANDVTIQLLPLSSYAGRALYIVNDNGPNNAIAQTATGEFFWDGSTSITAAPQETLTITAG